ncbi:hypothetical protein CAter282_1976 [Collimonas arenae]|uniref:Uncharacterized protein n=1 Tax=Collimonas arenae TaxID=279058 RepID=A0A127QI55_9BURK|nr:hypothetical protein CAter282_1976 [Collimonas arenae]
MLLFILSNNQCRLQRWHSAFALCTATFRFLPCWICRILNGII